MSTRKMISLPGDMYEELSALKKEAFFDRSFSEMIRHVLQIGLLTISQKTTNKED